MSRQLQRRIDFGAFAAALWVLVMAGCASWQGPRIDPSGERLLIWPNDSPPVMAAPPPSFPALGAPVVPPLTSAPPPPAVSVPQFMGNVEAPPVYSDPPTAPITPAPTVVPAPAIPAPPVQPQLPAPTLLIQSAPAPVAPIAATQVAGAMPIGQDHLRVTPERLLAPVGSEVVLKASVCAAGYLRTDRRVEWELARNGVGQFVNLGGLGAFDWLRWSWDSPRMIDPWHAIGVTEYGRVVLQRGNLDPSDDVVVEPGEAWISVMSPVEGTSQIRAYTPDVNSQFRQAFATILWVDVQWVFPPSAVVPADQPHVLTTCVARRTDGAPLAGWIVRYEVTSGGASLGYEAGNSVEVLTDASGRASVEVSPTVGETGVANVMMTLIRPAMAGPSANPPVEIARGMATISWIGAVSTAPVDPAPAISPPIVAPPGEPAPIVPPSTPADREPAPFDPTAPGTYTPPRDERPAGQPQLDVAVTRVGPEEVDVNQFVRFDVIVTNRGTGTARGIVVKAEFDAGLSHPRANSGEHEVEYKSMPDLLPGRSEAVPLTYKVVAAGRQCHRVTVAAEGGAIGFGEGCIIGREATPAAEPVLSVRKIGPTRQYVGEQAKFTIVLRNTGTVPVTNIEVVDKYDPAFKPVNTSREHERGADGSLIWKVAELAAGDRLAIDVFCECVADSTSACNNLIVTADGSISQADQVCVEILPQLPPAGVGDTQPPAAQPAPLRPIIAVTINPVNEGGQTTVLITVENTQQEALPQVQLRVALPPEMTPDTSTIEPRGESVVIGQEVRFNKVDFAPGRTEFKIPLTANQSGQVRIKVRLESEGLLQPIDVSSDVIEILPASL